MPFGYTGKILRVDLTMQKVTIDEQDEAFYRSYLGGRGIGYHYLMQMVPAGTGPFSADNILALASGVMTGAPLPAACRFAAVGKSPLTGTAGESEAAGFFGPELKMAGFDAVVFSGRAEKPVYLWLTEGKAEIRDASKIARLETKEVEDAIRKSHLHYFYKGRSSEVSQVCRNHRLNCSPGRCPTSHRYCNRGIHILRSSSQATVSEETFRCHVPNRYLPLLSLPRKLLSPNKRKRLQAHRTESRPETDHKPM